MMIIASRRHADAPGCSARATILCDSAGELRYATPLLHKFSHPPHRPQGLAPCFVPRTLNMVWYYLDFTFFRSLVFPLTVMFGRLYTGTVIAESAPHAIPSPRYRSTTSWKWACEYREGRGTLTYYLIDLIVSRVATSACGHDHGPYRHPGLLGLRVRFTWGIESKKIRFVGQMYALPGRTYTTFM